MLWGPEKNFSTTKNRVDSIPRYSIRVVFELRETFCTKIGQGATFLLLFSVKKPENAQKCSKMVKNENAKIFNNCFGRHQDVP